MKKLLFLLLLLVSVQAMAQQWVLDAEDPQSTIAWKDATATIFSPKGATLWLNEEMEGNTVIEYEARIVPDKRFRNDKGTVRISDLNCFWMANSIAPKGGSGKFVNNYSLQMYYLGYRNQQEQVPHPSSLCLRRMAIGQ